MKFSLLSLIMLLPVLASSQPSMGRPFSVYLNPQKGEAERGGISIMLRTTQDPYPFNGIPLDLNLHRVQEICFNQAQKDYENYRAGRLSEQAYRAIPMSNRDTAMIADMTYRHTVHVLVGFNTAGKKVVIFDKNQNRDFSDDVLLEFDTTHTNFNLMMEENHRFELPEIELNYEHFDGQQIQIRTAWLRFDPYRIIRLRRVKDEIERLLELRIIQDEYLDGIFSFKGQEYKVRVCHKVPSASTYLGPTVRTHISPKYRPMNLTQGLLRGDTLLLDEHPVILAGLSMYGDSLRLIELSEHIKLWGREPGFFARDMVFIDVTGASRRLSDCLKNDHYLVIDFWGTWSQPSIKRMPEVQDLSDKISRLKKVDMISVAYDQDINKVRSYIERYNRSWPQAFDDSNLSNNASSPVRQLQVKDFPAIFLIGPDGKILATDFAEISKWVDEKLE